MNAKEIAIMAAKIAEENKAEDIKILCVSDLIIITDYFVICSGMTRRHIQGLAKEIEVSLKKDKVKPYGKEGFEEGRWALLDYGDVVVHLYDKEARRYYELENLWADAPHLEFRTT